MAAAFGFGLFAAIDADWGFATFALGSFVFSVGMAPVFTLTTDLVIGSAPPERAGAASAISETSAELGGALGIALFGSIVIAVYRGMLAVPAGVPAEAAAAAPDTLGGAVAIAGQLPGSVGPELAAVARDAFMQGLRLRAAISAAASLALAIFVAATLRHVRPGGADSAAATPQAGTGQVGRVV